MAPLTRYARSGELHIAYSVSGTGPLDLVFVPSWISQLEHYWDEPAVSRYFTRLASFSRLIMFDRRGSGLSDPLASAPTLEEQMDDVLAVMAAAGSERAALFALLEGGPLAALFAATYPERVSALVLYEALPRMAWAPDYPWALRSEDREARLDDALRTWGDGSRMLPLSPRAAENPRLLAWYAKLERLAASPGTAARLMRMNGEVDVRAVLPSIQAPTLVLHQSADPFVDIRHSRHLAEHIPDAHLVELSGTETLTFGSDSRPELDAMERFLTGTPHDEDGERILATVLFTDIVDSTRSASEQGDAAWRDTLAALEPVVGRELTHHRGRAIKQLGDGFLATFDGPARAIRCACALRELARVGFGLELRSGLHTGEIELIGQDIGGIAVHLGARIEQVAAPGEVLVSSTVKDLVAGSGIPFESRGEHELRGIPDRWHLYAVA